MRRAIAAFVVACVAALAPLTASSQLNPVIGPLAFSVTVNGNAITVPLAGQGQCAVNVYAIGSATISAQISSDNVTYTSATAFNSAAPITAVGTYGGAVGPTGLTRFRLVVSGLTAGQTAAGSVTCSVGAEFTSGNPVPAGAGGLGPYALPSLAPGSTDVFDGDSMMAGFDASSCSGTYKTLIASPSGTCMSDLIAIRDAAKEMNLGVGGTCLQVTAIGGSNCNNSNSTSGSLISRYLTDLNFINAGNRVYVQIGTNDAFYWAVTPDTTIAPATFRANLVTVLSAFAAKTGSASNIVVGEIPYLPQSFQFYTDVLNAQIADVAKQYGYALASNSTTLQQCSVATYAAAQPSGNLQACKADPIHPNDTGYSQMASGFFAANYANAVAAVEASKKSLSIDSQQYSNSNVGAGGRGVLYSLTTGLNNYCGGDNSCTLITTGGTNTGLGHFALNALVGNSNNTCVGAGCLFTTTGANNTALGWSACANLVAATGVTCLAYNSSAGGASDSNEIVIGAGITGLGSNTVAIQVGTAPGHYSGSGAPSFSAPNGSLYLRYDLANPLPYINASGASTSGTTWTLVKTPSLVSCTDASVGVISCAATVAYTSTTSYACGMSYVGPTTTTGAATGITVVNTSNTSVTGTVVGLAVATGTATLLFNCTGS